MFVGSDKLFTRGDAAEAAGGTHYGFYEGGGSGGLGGGTTVTAVTRVTPPLASVVVGRAAHGPSAEPAVPAATASRRLGLTAVAGGSAWAGLGAATRTAGSGGGGVGGGGGSGTPRTSGVCGGGGGGGGSSYTEPRARNVVNLQGVNAGNGEIEISW